nr:TRAF2 and NCK-interacting protein kinase-like [Lytechinus pictus]
MLHGPCVNHERLNVFSYEFYNFQDLVALAAQLSAMGGGGKVDEDDDDDEEEDDIVGGPGGDGTIPASDAPRPLPGTPGYDGDTLETFVIKEDPNASTDSVESTESTTSFIQSKNAQPGSSRTQIDVAPNRQSRGVVQPGGRSTPPQGQGRPRSGSPRDSPHAQRKQEALSQGGNRGSPLGNRRIAKEPVRPGSLEINAGSSDVLPDLLPQQQSPKGASSKSQQVPQDKASSEEYRQAILAANGTGSGPKTPMRKQTSFSAFGFGASPTTPSVPSPPNRRGSNISVNVKPTTPESLNDMPEIRKYRKKFNSEILCASLWGVNLLIGTDNGLMLLDRSGEGKVYPLISRKRFQQMDVLESQNILVCIAGKKNKLRTYFLSWLKQKIVRNDGEATLSQQQTMDKRKSGFLAVGDLEGCIHYKIIKYEKIKFLVIALKDSIEIYAWAPKPYHKFMAFKSFPNLVHRPLIVDLTVEDNQRLKVIYGSVNGFHAIDLDSASVQDIYTPPQEIGTITPYCVVILPNSQGKYLLLCFNNEGVFVDTRGVPFKDVILQWGELPASVVLNVASGPNYRKIVVEDGLAAQLHNPEVKLTSRERELLNALQLMDKLEHKTEMIERFLKSTMEDSNMLPMPGSGDYYSGSGDGEFSGSGDLSGSGSGDGEDSTTQFSFTTVTPNETDFSFEPTSRGSGETRTKDPHSITYRPATDPNVRQTSKPRGAATSLHSATMFLTSIMLSLIVFLHW